MKAALVLCCLALFVAIYASEEDGCNPNGNNQPDCTLARNLGINIRNFWDPTRYWVCNSTEAVSVGCELVHPNGTRTPRGFLVSIRDCVDWKNWTWTPPCPEN